MVELCSDGVLGIAFAVVFDQAGEQHICRESGRDSHGSQCDEVDVIWLVLVVTTSAITDRDNLMVWRYRISS